MSEDLESDLEEEILVYAEFDSNLSVGQYQNINILGLDDAKPIIQLDDAFFMGKYESSLGTYMFFEEDPSPQTSDPLFDKLPEHSLKYVTKTRKHLVMEHAYVIPKAGKETDIDIKTEKDEESDVQPINFATIQEAVDTIGKFLSEDVSTQHDKS